MSTEFNSKLIDRLYQENDSEKATLISDEMVEIGDAIFIYPIFAAYKKFQSTSVSHYFVSDLKEFKQEEAVEILKGLCVDELAIQRNLSYLMDFCIKNDYFLESFTQKVREEFKKKFFENKELGYLDEYELADYLDYFLFAKIFEEAEEAVIGIYENTEIGKLPKTALQYLLKYNKSKYFQYYYDNYQKLKGKKAEIILAEEICSWKGAIIDKIKEKILAEGSGRAQEIINNKIKKEKQAESQKVVQKEEEIKIKFNNVEIINEIAELRGKINLLSAGNKLFNFPLLVNSELLFKQMQPPTSGPEIADLALGLREIIQGIDKKVGKHGYSLEEADKIILGIKEFASINNLHLFLISKKVAVDETFFGLRPLNIVLAKIAHPKDQEALSLALRNVGCYDFYINEKWPELHRKLLEIYKSFLLKLETAIRGDKSL